MADPVRTEDFPDFDTYPGAESSPARGERLLVVASDVVPGAESDERDSRLHEAAEQIGSTLGRAVRAVQNLPDTMDQARTDLSDRLSVIRGGAEREDVAGKVDQVKDLARERLEEVRRRALALTRDARARARHMVDEQPLVVLLGIFVGTFALGAALRIWRSHE